MSSIIARKVNGRPLIARNVSGELPVLLNRTPSRDARRLVWVLLVMIVYTAVYYRSGS